MRSPPPQQGSRRRKQKNGRNEVRQKKGILVYIYIYEIIQYCCRWHCGGVFLGQTEGFAWMESHPYLRRPGRHAAANTSGRSNSTHAVSSDGVMPHITCYHTGTKQNHVTGHLWGQSLIVRRLLGCTTDERAQSRYHIVQYLVPIKHGRTRGAQKTNTIPCMHAPCQHGACVGHGLCLS